MTKDVEDMITACELFIHWLKGTEFTWQISICLIFSSKTSVTLMLHCLSSLNLISPLLSENNT